MLRGVLGVVVGIFILARPLESVAALALVIALWALIDGTVDIVQAFDRRPAVRHWWVRLIGGIVSVVFGVAALYYYPVLSLTFAVLWAALWLIVIGAVELSDALFERRLGRPWGWMIGLGLLTIALGIVAVISPGLTLVSLIWLLAAYGLVGGMVLLVDAATGRSPDRSTAQPA
jgi:uncharacterized membrane protein HdeD (DUF308 family)